VHGQQDFVADELRASLMVGWYWNTSGLLFSNKQASLVRYGMLMMRGSW
jgi:hypothetical protein